jgi:hypothetical protein
MQTSLDQLIQPRASTSEREARPLPSALRHQINQLAHQAGQQYGALQHGRMTALAKVQIQQGASVEQALDLVTQMTGIVR